MENNPVNNNKNKRIKRSAEERLLLSCITSMYGPDVSVEMAGKSAKEQADLLMDGYNRGWEHGMVLDVRPLMRGLQFDVGSRDGVKPNG